VRTLAAWLFAWLVFAGVFALGAAALVLALFAGPAVLLAARLLSRRGRTRAAERARRAGGAVYEGEFHVLEETPAEHP
jgi:hypothetical protein